MTSTSILDRIADARARGLALILTMSGGSRGPCISAPSRKFNLKAWKLRVARLGSRAFGLLLGFILLACTVPTATALPQTAPIRQTLLSAGGDTIPMFGTFTFKIDSIQLRRQAPVIVKTTDTLWLPDTLVPRAPAVGIPFMITNLFRQSASQPDWGPGPFTGSINSDGPTVIVQRINAARALKHQLIVTMTGGGKKNYTVEGTDPGTFSLAKWKARQDLFNTPQIKAAIAGAVADGTVRGANMLDEPQHIGWKNSITKATVDSMALYLKTLYPTLPAGVSVKMSWRPLERFTKLDFIVTQWIALWGPVEVWRDAELAAAKLNGVAVVFSINGGNGGAGFEMGSCPPPTGGAGYDPGRCAMGPGQIRETALALMPYSCALNVWEFRPSLVAKPENLLALTDVAAVMSQLPAKPCRRAA